jgi:hypothetical protein
VAASQVGAQSLSVRAVILGCAITVPDLWLMTNIPQFRSPTCRFCSMQDASTLEACSMLAVSGMYICHVQLIYRVAVESNSSCCMSPL